MPPLFTAGEHSGIRESPCVAAGSPMPASSQAARTPRACTRSLRTVCRLRAQASGIGKYRADLGRSVRTTTAQPRAQLPWTSFTAAPDFSVSRASTSHCIVASRGTVSVLDERSPSTAKARVTPRTSGPP